MNSTVAGNLPREQEWSTEPGNCLNSFSQTETSTAPRGRTRGTPADETLQHTHKTRSKSRGRGKEKLKGPNPQAYTIFTPDAVVKSHQKIQYRPGLDKVPDGYET